MSEYSPYRPPGLDARHMVSLTTNSNTLMEIRSQQSEAEILLHRRALINIVELAQVASRSNPSPNDLSLIQQLAKDTQRMISEGLGEEHTYVIQTQALEQTRARSIYDNAKNKLSILHEQFKSERRERTQNLEMEIRKLTRRLNSAKSMEEDAEYWVSFWRYSLNNKFWGAGDTLERRKEFAQSIEKSVQEEIDKTRSKRKREDEEEDRWTDEANQLIQIDWG